MDLQLIPKFTVFAVKHISKFIDVIRRPASEAQFSKYRSSGHTLKENKFRKYK
jgi:hypothetical protein